MDQVSLNAVGSGYVHNLAVPFCDNKLGSAALSGPFHPLMAFVPPHLLNGPHGFSPANLNVFPAPNNDSLKANGFPTYWNPLMTPWLGSVPDYSAAAMLNSALLQQAHQLSGLMQMSGGGNSNEESFLSKHRKNDHHHRTPSREIAAPEAGGETFLETLSKINSSVANKPEMTKNKANVFHPCKSGAVDSFVPPAYNAVAASCASPFEARLPSTDCGGGGDQSSLCAAAAADRASASLQRVSTSSSPASNESSRSNLATLAEVACRLTPERPSRAKRGREPPTAAAPPARRDADRACIQPIKTEFDQNLINASTMAWAALTSQLLAAAEMQDYVLSTNSKLNGGSFVEQPTNRNAGKTPDLAPPHAVEPKRINQPKEAVFNNDQSKSDSVGAAKRRPYKKKGGARIASENPPSAEKTMGSIEDTIDSVIRLHSDVHCSVGNLLKAIPNQAVRKPTNHQIASTNQNSAPHSSSTSHVITQTNHVLDCSGQSRTSIKRSNGDAHFQQPQERSATVEICDNSEILDLSVRKKQKKQALDRAEPSTIPTKNKLGPSCSISAIDKPSSSICRPPIVGRRVVDADVARRPLNVGWRRQTCVRAISASGVRGDVLYYSPCGRKFASVAEIARYLKKQPADQLISVEYFTFSSKVIVGEYFCATQVGIKNMSESDVKEMISSIQRASIAGKQSTKKLPADCSKVSFVESPLSHEDHFNAVKYGTLESGISRKNSVVEDDDEIEESVACCIIDLINWATSVF